jgi:hypothetical protein
MGPQRTEVIAFLTALDKHDGVRRVYTAMTAT